MRLFRLRYRAHDIELPVGEFVIGRSEECQLSIDDPMVSRRHGAIRVTPDAATVVDLNSRNGVHVNGDKIDGEKLLADGDRISIGKHELVVSAFDPKSRQVRQPLARTLGPVELQELEAILPPSNTDSPPQGMKRIVSNFATLAILADKALALGRPEEAERLLASPLNDVMREIRRGAASPDQAAMQKFASYAMKLAAGLSKATWVDWIFEAYHKTGYFIPGPLVDDLFAVAPKLRHLQHKPILEYAEWLARNLTLTANERFLLQRLESLANQLASGT
ncbi:MAG: FHA domain-containing protein [Polyangiaceae bacterium]